MYLLLALIFFELFEGSAWKWQKYPNPLNDSNDLCKRRGNTSWICDPDSVISRSDADKVDILLKKIRTSTLTKCSPSGQESGYRVGVAIAVQIYDDGQIKDSRFRTFAYNVREYGWKLPSSINCDDSVLMVLSKNNRYVYISTGSEARRKLTCCAVEEVIKKMRTTLSKSRFGPAFVRGVTEMYPCLNKTKSSCSCTFDSGLEEDPPRKLSPALIVIFIIGGLVFIYGMWAVCTGRAHLLEGGRSSGGSRWWGGGGGGMESLWTCRAGDLVLLEVKMEMVEEGVTFEEITP